MIKIVILYLFGVICNYLFFKSYLTTYFKKWTVRDRNFALMMSILSWLAVLGLILKIFMEFLIKEINQNGDKPSKW